MSEKTEKRNSFSSSVGFVLAAAGSAVGLGNIWRFPYLAAKDGGGLFLLIYLILAVTFGYTLMVCEIAIGRKTKQGCLTAYKKLHKHSGWIGIFASIVPFLILPYYAIIGGWVLKYAVAFLTGNGGAAAQEGYFSNFITGYSQPIIFDMVFLLATAVIIYMGVNKGIEAISRILMPMLLVVVVGIAIFALTIKGEDGRTGLDGLKVFLIPDTTGMTYQDIFITVMDAMGQLFYSISVAMGIMVTYGSYYKDDSNLLKSVNQIEFFDSLVAFLAGVMVIPPVVAFMGVDKMKATAGPSLMFVTLPQVFDKMGIVGNVVGAIFFVMVLFAALTSCISIFEAVASGFIDRLGWSRKKATLVVTAAAAVIGVFICLGYNVFYFEYKLPNGNTAQLLDIFDYISNNLLMPIVAIGTCILVGWIIKPRAIIDEATKNGEKFRRKHLFYLMVRIVAPVLLFLLFLGSLNVYKKLGLA